LTLEDQISEQERNLKKVNLPGDEINTNFVVATILKDIYGVEFIKDGIIHGPGWVAKELPNFETIRVTWARMRNQKGYARERQYKEVMGKKDS